LLNFSPIKSPREILGLMIQFVTASRCKPRIRRKLPS
jgi:hypothetical protein